MLGPYADDILLLGPLLHEGVRTSPEGRPMLVAAALAAWVSSGALSSSGSAHRHLPLLVATALKEHVLPIELSAAITVFPAMLRDLGARLAWSDPSKRPAVEAGRFSCALNSLPVLGELLEGEVKGTKYGTACLVLMAQLPKVTPPSLEAFIQLECHLASEGFDLGDDTAADRIAAMTTRATRDVDLREAAPY